MARKSSGSASRVRKVQVNEEEPEIIDLEQDEPREVETVEKEAEQTVSEPAKDRTEKKKFGKVHPPLITLFLY